MRRGIRLTSYASPCMNCEDRHVGCHSECEKYRQYKGVVHDNWKRSFKQEKIDKALNALEWKRKDREVKEEGGHLDPKEFSKRRK